MTLRGFAIFFFGPKTSAGEAQPTLTEAVDHMVDVLRKRGNLPGLDPWENPWENSRSFDWAMASVNDGKSHLQPGVSWIFDQKTIRTIEYH